MSNSMLSPFTVYTVSGPDGPVTDLAFVDRQDAELYSQVERECVGGAPYVRELLVCPPMEGGQRLEREQLAWPSEFTRHRGPAWWADLTMTGRLTEFYDRLPDSCLDELRAKWQEDEFWRLTRERLQADESEESIQVPPCSGRLPRRGRELRPRFSLAPPGSLRAPRFQF